MPTTRSQTFDTSDQKVFSRTYSSSTNPGAWSLRNGSPGNYTNTVTFGDSVPDWKRKIARGESATSSLVGSESVRKHTEGYLLYEYQQWSSSQRRWVSTYYELKGGLSGYNSFPSPPPDALLAQAENQAIMGIVRKANQALRAVQGMVILGELGETLRMMRDPLKAIRKGMDNYLGRVRRDAGRYKRRLRPDQFRSVVSDLWLQTTFGLAPMVHDLDDIAKALPRILTYYAERQGVSYRAGVSKKTPITNPGVITFGPISVTRSFEREDGANVRYHGSVIARPPNTNFTMQTIGVTFRDFLPSAYELIPWSFLADYFSNCQEIVEGLSFNRAAVAWMERGEEHYVQVNCTGAEHTDAPLSTLARRGRVIFVPGTFSYRRRSVSRGNYQGSYVPTLEFTIPGLAMQWLNIAALARNHRRTLQVYSHFLG